MKYYAVYFIAVLLILIGCKGKPMQNEKNIYNSVYYANGKEEYYYYDDILTEKPKITIDTAKLLSELDLLMPSKQIASAIKTGYNNFYFMLMIGDTISYKIFQYINLRTDMGWITFYADNNLVIDYPFSRRIVKTPLFFTTFYDEKKVFKTTKGKIDKKEVPSLKLYEICIKIGDDGSKKTEWKISDYDIDKLRPQMMENNQQDQYSQYANDFLYHPLMIGGYKTMKEKIIYPEEARRENISGKVLVKVFINQDGSVGGTQLLKGLGYGCDEEAIKAIKESRFILLKKGLYQINIPFVFELSKDTNFVDLVSNISEKIPRIINSGKGLNLEFNISNAGDNFGNYKNPFAQKFRYVFLIDDKIVSGQEFPIGDIFPITVFAHWNGSKRGFYKYKLYIDPDNILPEIDRNNNYYEGSFEVK